MNFIIQLLIFLIILTALGVGGYFIYKNYFEKKSSSQPTSQPTSQQSSSQQSSSNDCNKGPQRKLMGHTCQDIASIKFSINDKPTVFEIIGNNQQNVFMKQKGIDFTNLGYKYEGEDCWFEPLENCIRSTCLNQNLNPRDVAICKIKYMLNNYGPSIAFDPWVDKTALRYNINKSELGL